MRNSATLCLLLGLLAAGCESSKDNPTKPAKLDPKIDSATFDQKAESNQSDRDTAKSKSAAPLQRPENDANKQLPADPTKKRELLAPGEPIVTDEFSITVPDGWKNDPTLATRTKKLFIVGDGKGLPAFDDTQSPLQLGMEVEHYTDKETIQDRIKILTEDARNAPQRTLASEPTIENVELADGTKGSLMFVEMIKQGLRRTLYMKLLVQDQSGTTWVTSSWIVASKNSNLPKKDSNLANKMKKFMLTFALAKERDI